MSTVRDRALPAIDKARSRIAAFGLRRYAVTLRRRIWSGAYVGDGTVSNVDIVIVPTPRVRNKFSAKSISPQALEYILMNGNVISDRLYVVDQITPAFSFTERSEHEFSSTLVTRAGGYLPEQLRMRPSPDVRNVEPVVILVGDDGYARECSQLTFEQDRAFHYAMLVKETDRPRALLRTIAVTPAPLALAVGATKQLACEGTFEDGLQSAVTPLATWSSSDPTKARVDILGRVTGAAAGTAVITASLFNSTASTTVTVS